MALPFYSWSLTAANNATADSTVNWAEGMAPSAVNDSGRAMMASAAAFRDDISGATATGGSSTAYTVTSNQVFDTLAHMSGAMIAFTPHTTCGDAPTLNVDGLGAKKIRFVTGTDIPEGSLIEGTPYVVTYYNSVGEFILHNIAGNPYTIPLGGGLDYWGTTAPNSAFAFPSGQAISRTTYASLWGVFGTTYGAGDGSTTFNLPDKRGRVSAGKDDMGGSAASRLTSSGAVNGASLGYGGGSQSHSLVSGENGPHTHTASTVQAASTFVLTINGNKALIDTTATSPMTPGGSAVVGTSGITQSPSVTIPTLSLNLSTSVDSSGSGTAHNNVQPTIVCNYIIRIK